MNEYSIHGEAGTNQVWTAKETLSVAGELLEYKQRLLDSFGPAYDTYNFILDSIGDGPTVVSRLDSELARTELDNWLTSARVQAMIEDMENYAVNLESGSPEVGFDILLLPNEDLTFTEETKIAERIQEEIPFYSIPFSDKKYQYVSGKYHNAATASAKSMVDSANPVRILAAPRHYNVPRGTVAENIAYVENHNARHAKVQLRFASDLEAMTHIHILIVAGLLNTVENRYDSTHYRNLAEAPTEGFVPSVCVHGSGRLYRDASRVDRSEPTRALLI